MKSGKTLSDLYHHLASLEESHLAKHTISALILGVFEKLESTNAAITPGAVEKALKEELGYFSLKASKKKKSA